MADNNPSNQELVDQMVSGAGSFGAKMAEIGRDIMKSDMENAIAHLQGYIQPVCKMAPIVQKQVEELPGDFGSLTRESSTPAIEAVDCERLGWGETEFDFDMKVASHTEVESDTAVKVHSETEIKAGWGPVSFKQSISADISHSNHNARTTDMSGRIAIRGKLVRRPVPEGLQKAIDISGEFSETCNRLRLQIVQAELAKKLRDAAGDAGGDAGGPAGGDAGGTQ